jgi:hypothetical protein
MTYATHESIRAARNYVENLGLRLVRLARRNDEDGPRFAVIDPWTHPHWNLGIDRTEGLPSSGFVLKRATLPEVWAWLEEHEPRHGRIVRDAGDVWRESIGLPTLAALGVTYYSDLESDDADES